MKTVSNAEMIRYLCHFVRNHGKVDPDETCYAAVVIASEPLSGGCYPVLVSLYYGPTDTELRAIPVITLHEENHLGSHDFDMVPVDIESYYPEYDVSGVTCSIFGMVYLATAGL